MKQIAYVHIEVEKDEKNYAFSMPMGVPLADASEVAFRMFKTIDAMYREALDKEIKAQEEKSENVELKADDSQ